MRTWDDPTVNYGPTGGLLRPPFYERDREIADLEVWLMLSDLEHHANRGVGVDVTMASAISRAC